MTVKYQSQTLDSMAVRTLLNSPAGGVVRNLLRRGLAVETMAKRLVKRDHGRLANSITHRVVLRSSQLGQTVPIVEVGTNVKYALAVHNGTGIYGPRGAVIRPTRGRYLKFTPRVAGGQLIPGRNRQVVFAKFVRGQTPNPFLKDAMRAARGVSGRT
jgi:hypothetical protein